jgi:hypothetical protein
MTDHELDRLLPDASPLTDARAAALELRDAETELLETIMATSTDQPTELVVSPLSDNGHQPPYGPRRVRRQRRLLPLAAAAAVGFLVAVAVITLGNRDDSPPAVTADDPPPAEDDEVPRLLAADIPAPYQLANTMTMYTDGEVASDQPSPGAGVSYTAYYSPPGPGPNGLAWITVETRAGEPFPESGRPVTVRGHEGRIESVPTNGSMIGSITVRWTEAPGVHVLVSASNSDLTEDDVLAIAESLEPVDEATWDRGSTLNDPLTPDALRSLVPGDARASIVLEVRGMVVYKAADGQVCTFQADQRGETPPACGDPAERVHLFKDRIGWPAVLYGVLPPGAVEVEATRGGSDISGEGGIGPVVPAAFTAPDMSGGPTLYAVSIGLVPDTVTFLDATGQPVETVPLDIDPEL